MLFTPKIVLFITGWSDLDKEEMAFYQSIDRKIVIFTHSTTFDYPITLLIQLCYSEINNDIFILMKPQMFEYLGSLWSKLGCIPSTRVEERNGQAVERICKVLNGREKFSLLLSPKGTVKKRNWRTGYYYLAQELNVPIIVVGLDYNKHKPVINKKIITVASKEIHVVQKEIIDLFQSINCLHPENEYIYKLSGNSNHVSLIKEDGLWFRICVVFLSILSTLYLI